MNTIGASFSGGGFRAAAFTFGCLDLLQRVKLGDRTLLQNIAFSSSTSGGSIAMAYHAVRSYRGDAFPAILEGARKHMTGETLLAEAIAVLNDPAPWKEYPAKTRNLINAFAIVYDRTLYQGARSGLFTDRSKQPPIPRYCFNTTELNNCMSFRFDLSGEARYTEQVGNWHQHFAPMSDAVNGMRIADIAAASSCFPGGFEPLLFPRDLQDAPHNDPLETAIVDDTGQPLPEARRVFGLSDGGVVDNQGLYALKVEADRRHERNTWAKNAGRRPEGDEVPFDLLISCDVSSFYVDAYAAPDAQAAWRPGLRLDALVVIVLFALLCTALAWPFALCSRSWPLLAALTLPAVLSLFALVKVGTWLLGGGSGSWGSMFTKYGKPTLKRMSLATLGYMLQARLRSLGLIFNDAFMTQIRRQQYGALYDGALATPVVSCMVYELASKNSKTRKRRMDQREEQLQRAVSEGKIPAARLTAWKAAVLPLQPSPAKVQVADSAASMSTTLWFDQDNAHKLDDLLACGSFTMCYNLLVYLADREAATGALSAEEAALRKQLLSIW